LLKKIISDCLKIYCNYIADFENWHK